MMLTPENASLSSYTDDTWTLLTDVPGIYQTIILANNGAGDITAEIKIIDSTGPTDLCQILPPTIIAADEPVQTLDISSIALKADQEIHVRFDAAGMEVFISGSLIT